MRSHLILTTLTLKIIKTRLREIKTFTEGPQLVLESAKNSVSLVPKPAL